MWLVDIILNIIIALRTASDSSIIKDENGLIYEEDGNSVGNPHNRKLSGDISVLTQVVVTEYNAHARDWRDKVNTYTYPVLQVKTGTFTHQDEITAIKLPAITAIRVGAIADLPKLQSISIDNVVPPEVGSDNFTGIPPTAKLLVPFAGVSQYRRHDMASRFAGVYAIGCRHPETSGHVTCDSVECAVKEAFAYCVDIRSLSFTDTVKSIGDACFANCIGLTDAELPRNLETMGERVFKGCKALAKIHVPGTLTDIPPMAFSGCTSLTDVSIADGVKSIGLEAFRNCTSLKRITLPATIETVMSKAFSGCKGLTDVICEGDTPPMFMKDVLNPLQATLHVPKGCAHAYEKMNWRYKNFNKIKESSR